MKKRRLHRSFALLAAVSLVVAACGGDDDADEPDTEATADDSDAEPADDDGDGGESDADDDTGDDGVIEAGTEAEGDVDTEVEENTASERTYGGTVTIGLEAEAPGLRPWEDTLSSPVYNIAVSMFDKLMEISADGVTYEPWLAESITPNDDFTVWTMTLRPGVTFHNGTALTGQTIADMFAVQQTGSAAQGHIAATTLQSVEATGDLEVTYTLGQANSAFPTWLERAPLGMVFEPAAAAADPEGAANNPIGTGPFMLDSRDIDNETIVVRNENWWHTDPDGNQLPYLDSIVFRPIPDELARLDALLSRTTNAMQTLRQGTIRDARASEGIDLYEFQGSNVGGGMFNMLIPPYDDLRVRRGLTMMNDQEAVIEALGGTGISLPGTQWFSPDSPWYSPEAAAAYVGFDFNAGRSLVQEYVDDPARSDGKSPGDKIAVDLTCPPDPSLLAAMQVIEQLWTASELVEVNLQNFDQQTHIGMAVQDQHGAHCWRFRDDNDPATYVTAQLLPPTPEIAEAAGMPGVVSPVNWANFFDGEALQAGIGAIQTDDLEARKAAYSRVAEIFNEQSAIWFSGHTATLIAVDPSVQGLNSWHLPSGNLGVGHPNAEGHWSEVWISE